jgi:4-amino-4-deoxy-L-arabinose transferase-like glycosyltransferase
MERNILGGFVLLAAAARFSVLDSLQFVTWDGAYYINFFRDEAWRWVFPPGYPIFIELVRSVVGDGVRAAQIVSLTFGSALPVPLYFLAKKFLRTGLAFAAVLIVTFNPLMVRYGGLTMSESVFIFFAVLAFAFFAHSKFIAFGLSAAVAYLARPEALVFFGALMAILILRRQTRPLAWAALGFAILAVPYIISMRVEMGIWTLSPKVSNLRVWEQDWRANVARERQSADAATTGKVIESSLDNYPPRFVAYASHLFTFGGAPLILAGLVGMLRHRNMLLAGVLMLAILPLFGLNTFERFILPYIPFFAVFGMMAVQPLKWQWSGLLLTALTLISLLPTLSVARQPDEEFPEMRDAGRALRSVTHSTDVFWDRKPYTAFYAGGRYEPVPNEPLDTLMTLFHSGAAKYLVLHYGVTRVFRPQLVPLLNDDTLVEQHKLRTVLNSRPGSALQIKILEVNR